CPPRAATAPRRSPSAPTWPSPAGSPSSGAKTWSAPTCASPAWRDPGSGGSRDPWSRLPPLLHNRPMSDFIIGLTGGVASGKSAVAEQFAALGVHVADADVAAREAVAIGSPGLAAVVE